MVDGVTGAPKPYVTTGANCAQVTANQTGTSGTNEAADWATTSVLWIIVRDRAVRPRAHSRPAELAGRQCLQRAHQDPAADRQGPVLGQRHAVSR